jgi:quercetin dioxygenase-like cupin family protein
MAPAFVEYRVDKGIGFGRACFNEDNISVQYAAFSAGSEFARHTHAVREWLLIFEGSLRAMTEEGTVDLHPGEYIVFEPGQEHECRALTDVRLIGVTIPPAEGYPDARSSP